MRVSNRLSMALMLAGCAGRGQAATTPTGGSASPSATASTTSTAATSTGTTAAEGRRAASRALLADATFEELVAGIGADEGRESETRHCLLARTEDGFRIEADLAVAVHPVASPLPDLDSNVEGAPSVRVLSRWGRHGLGPGAVTLAALTDTPATRSAWALVLTDRGFYLRPTDGLQTIHIEAAPDASLRERLRETSALGADVSWFVSAERAVPVSRLEAALRDLTVEHRGPVGLAVVLAPDTTLPPPRAVTAVPVRCPEGLPESEEREGDLTVAALTAALTPLRERAASCLDHADAGGAAGGRLVIGLRIRADGRVDQACMIADETDDDALAACVLGAARELPFPAPAPAGFVDVQLPLVLRPNSAPAQPAVCPPTQPHE